MPDIINEQENQEISNSNNENPDIINEQENQELSNSSNENPDEKTASFHLPYFKQGDDMYNCLVKNVNGKVDAKRSIDNHIGLLQLAINNLQELKNALPDDEEFNISPDTHSIFITGPKATIERLEQDGILQADAFQEEELSDSEYEYEEDEGDVIEMTPAELLEDWQAGEDEVYDGPNPLFD